MAVLEVCFLNYLDGIIYPWHAYAARFTLVVPCICICLSMTIFRLQVTLLLMSNINSFSVTCTQLFNGDISETAVFELEMLAVTLSKLPGPLHQSGVAHPYLLCLAVFGGDTA